jgi:hypothetical protein
MLSDPCRLAPALRNELGRPSIRIPYRSRSSRLVKICLSSRVCGESAADGQRSHPSGANAVAVETGGFQLSVEPHSLGGERPIATILLKRRGILPKSQLAKPTEEQPPR